jgi:hypothetical protein
MTGLRLGCDWVATGYGLTRNVGEFSANGGLSERRDRHNPSSIWHPSLDMALNANRRANSRLEFASLIGQGLIDNQGVSIFV